MYSATYTSQHAAHSYQNIDVQTASPARLIALLFATMNTRLQAAQTLMEQQAPAVDVMPVLGRVYDILNELEASLDLQQGGVLASNLLALYRYIRGRLQDGRDRLEAVAEARRLIEPLADAWSELAAGPAPVMMPTARLVA